MSDLSCEPTFRESRRVNVCSYYHGHIVNWNFYLFTFPSSTMEFRIVLLLLTVNLSLSQSLEIGTDGGYQNIVIRIEDDAASNKDCRNILNSLNTFLTSSSEALQSALSGDSIICVKIFYGST